MLAKNRKPTTDKFQVMVFIEKVANEVVSIVNDETKIPKRKRNILGTRIIDHAVGCYESIRYANSIFPSETNQMLIKDRLEHIKKTDFYISALISDLTLLENVMYKNTNVPKWLTNLHLNAIECSNLIRQWRISEIKKYEK